MVLSILRSKKFAKRVLFALLVLIIPAFVLWGVGNISQRPPLIGQIGGQKIQATDLAKSAQGVRIQILLTYFNDPETLNRILQNRTITNFMAWERLIFLNAARKNRIKVNDREVMTFISQHPLFQKNGIFDMKIYTYILRNMLSINPAQFEKLVKENLEVRKFRQNLLGNITIDDDDLLSFYKAANDKVDISYVLIGKSLFIDKINVEPEEIRTFYANNKNAFLSPAEIDIEYVEIPYDEEKRTTATETIRKMYPELQASPNKFSTIAEKNGFRYGRTGLFSQNELIPGIQSTKTIHDLAFSMKVDEISPPVFSESDKGKVYILRKLKHVPPAPLQFEEVRDNIRDIILDSKCLGLAEEKASQLHERITKGGMPLEEAGKIHGQVSKTASGIGPGDYIQDVGPAGAVVARALKSGAGAVLPPMTVKEKGVLLIRVDKIIPVSEENFEKQKEPLRQELLARKQMAAIDKWMEENSSKIRLKIPLDEI
ncbi:MAG: peptidylprolyl isomerase [Candidatus Omnitrophota bacterium]